MAGFDSAVGHTNLPNGKWSPIVFSKNALMFFRITSVADEITNTEYEGEISGKGSEVRIIKEPLVTVQDVARGTKLQTQDIADEDIIMNIDIGKAFQFSIDDIEKAFETLSFEKLAEGSAAYALRDEFDKNVLAYMAENATQPSTTGTDASPVTVGLGAGNDFTPLDYINEFATLLDENTIPTEGRYFVGTPRFYQQLNREDSKAIDASVMGDAASMIRMRKMGTSKPLHDFTMWKSVNLVNSTSNNRVRVIAGHLSAVATATAITKSEVLRSQDSFADIYRGMLVFGRKLLRPEALFVGHVTLGDVS